ncbi:MAG: translocase [Acidobacteria bacterium]|nr:translocase [Acidobacteriota bacterium]
MTPAAVEPFAPRQRKSWLDRALSVAADVRAGEAAGALLLAANVFALLACYYVLKTVRESLILSEGGAEVKSYAAAGQALLLLGFVPLYGALAMRVDRVRLISGVTLFFASHLAVFYLLGRAGIPVGVPFFLWIGIFNVVVIAQFWAFANDLYDSERGKRLFPVVGIGSALGAWVGAEAASALFARVGPYELMLLSAVGLTVCVFLTRWSDRSERHDASRGTGPSGPARDGSPEPPMGRAGGFQLVLSQRYLLLIGLLVLVLNIVNTVGEYILGRLVVQDAAARIAAGAAGGLSQEALIGRFYGNFFGWVNLLGLLFQLLLVSRLFRWIGVRGTLFVLPLVAMFSYSLLAVVPLLTVVSVVKVLENSSDYSINNTAKHALFLPTSREAKYKAKQAIDSFFWRTGDMLQALVVFVGVQLAFGIRGFAAVNLAFVAVWILLVLGIAAEHRKLTAADAAQRAA